jgi:SAM-dependent MidA family methyltransferase
MSSITFAEFMRRALYDPTRGYYMTDREHFGKRGDFNTISAYGELFGQIMAGEFAALFRELESPSTFTIIELGPGNGDFARHVLTELHEHFNDVFQVVRYLCVEISPFLADKQRLRLEGFSDRVAWYNEVDKLPAWLTGVFFSNEFFDALPVHIVRQQPAVLNEVFVDENDGGPVFREAELSSARLREYWSRAGTTMQPGQLAEINLEAIDLLELIGARLKRGRVVTIDYGDLAANLYDNTRPQGTLRCFSHHSLNDEPLANIGEQDLTASVNFTSLMAYGRDFGLETVSFENLADHLTKKGMLDRAARELSRHSAEGPALEKSLALKQLFVPHGIAAHFKILLQEKK